MTRKVYRTAQGKLVDLGRLQLQNENTRAVGNMGVNARGDRIDGKNVSIEKRPTAVQRQYNKQTSNTAAANKPSARATPLPQVPTPPEDFQDDFVKEDAQPAATGLAAAIAKAREIRQEPLRSPQQIAQQQEGVKKL